MHVRVDCAALWVHIGVSTAGKKIPSIALPRDRSTYDSGSAELYRLACNNAQEVSEKRHWGLDPGH
eukprot:scaffold106351_cov33-Tisochrysis_lutea.AAC.1